MPRMCCAGGCTTLLGQSDFGVHDVGVFYTHVWCGIQVVLSMRHNKLNLLSRTIKVAMSGQDVPEPLVSRVCIICLENVPDKDTGPAMMHCPRCTGVWCVSHYEHMSKEECPQCRLALGNHGTASHGHSSSGTRPCHDIHDDGEQNVVIIGRNWNVMRIRAGLTAHIFSV